MPRLSPEEQRQRAKLHFEKIEREKGEAVRARAEYQKKANAEIAKTARLRELRLAKEAADAVTVLEKASERGRKRAAAAGSRQSPGSQKARP